MPSRKSFFIPNRYLHGRIVYCMPMDYNERLDDVWHHHDFDEIVVVCSGAGIHVAENGEYPIRKGDTFFIPCGEFHGYKNLKHLRIVNILFKKMPGMENSAISSIPSDTKSFSKTMPDSKKNSVSETV